VRKKNLSARAAKRSRSNHVAEHKFDAIKLTGMALALVPLLFWATVRPKA
jgi:hypothetical protein